MSETKAAYITTKAGRVHKAVLQDDRVLTDEACNLDDAEGRTVSFELPEHAEPGTLCGRCFAEREGEP